MSFKLLKRLLNEFRKKARCPACKSGFQEDLIFVLATLGNPDGNGCNALVFIVCPSCNGSALAVLGIGEFHYISQGTISVNDVLDMHNFLKNFQGGVQDLFKKRS